MDELLKIQEEALAKISACADAKELNDLRVFYLGKKGPIQAAMKSMKTMAPEERKTKFFKDTFDGLVKDYSKYLSQIDEKIAENNEIVSNFEKIQKIR